MNPKTLLLSTKHDATSGLHLEALHKGKRTDSYSILLMIQYFASYKRRDVRGFQSKIHAQTSVVHIAVQRARGGFLPIRERVQGNLANGGLLEGCCLLQAAPLAETGGHLLDAAAGTQYLLRLPFALRYTAIFLD